MTYQTHIVRRPDAELHVQAHGPAGAPAVYLAHSILSSSVMWQAQVQHLVQAGWRVINADTRGHGASRCETGEATMATLVDDTIAVLDALDLERVHYVGLSLGGMSGFGLGIHHADRLHSLCLCDARADAPPEVAAPWDERIAIAQREGCGALARGTLERWFGAAFLRAHPVVEETLTGMVSGTSTAGFVACARAIQSLDYLDQVGVIRTPTTLIVGANDGVLPAVMQDLQSRIAGACYTVIPAAGHLPNIDQAEGFNAVLARHLRMPS
jgi:3-oxoadipate enol-lactonase